MHQDLTSEEGFNLSWPKYMVTAMGPGKDLDAINRRSIEMLAANMEKLKAGGNVRVALWEWSRRIMVTIITEAIMSHNTPTMILLLSKPRGKI